MLPQLSLTNCFSQRAANCHLPFATCHLQHLNALCKYVRKYIHNYHIITVEKNNRKKSTWSGKTNEKKRSKNIVNSKIKRQQQQQQLSGYRMKKKTAATTTTVVKCACVCVCGWCSLSSGRRSRATKSVPPFATGENWRWAIRVDNLPDLPVPLPLSLSLCTWRVTQLFTYVCGWRRGAIVSCPASPPAAAAAATRKMLLECLHNALFACCSRCGPCCCCCCT